MKLTNEIKHALMSYENQLNQVVNTQVPQEHPQDWREYMQLLDLMIEVGIE